MLNVDINGASSNLKVVIVIRVVLAVLVLIVMGEPGL